ncbi:conserved hypothetical protein [Uncinocarpus reesii 1704]|uniref:LAA1-like C-terminal TPR repeats domain-containing protein n=1 Tax=Uncinocarpus reesii (strain UAMH 1704) TaxID=336963 RepID=C4JR41_UNCRE|nr:uncharacterized protein UREG_03523 [Uncinocarpus reesii 1704]EEP78677.1 conserved hypothetical protein [Uncinocarpus reesii 1704]
MSAPGASASQAASSENVIPRAELDVSKLHALPSEQQDLYLLTFTADLVQYTAKLDKDEISSQQGFIKQELFKIIKLPSPVPSRVIRNNIGRCFGAIFTRGNRAILYDTVNELIGILNAGKNELDLKAKFAAAVALGDIFVAAGDGIINQSSVTVSALFKLLKSSQNHAGLRGCIYSAVRKVVSGIGIPIDESTAKDIWKHARNAAVGDKAYSVQASACLCLGQLIRNTPYFNNANDFENLKSTIWKVMDSPITSVRHASAACLAEMLVKCHSARGHIEVPIVKRPKKPLKKAGPTTVEDEVPERPQSPSGRKAETILAFKLPDLLRQLSLQYCRMSTGNRARAGIAVCYKLVLRALGEKLVEERYAEIAGHLLVTLLNHATIVNNRYRLLMTRKFIKHILEDVVGSEILSENGQLNAARWLVNDLLKDYPQVLQERREPSKHTLTCAVSALSSLICSLGSAVGSIADSCREALLQDLQHSSYTVQIYVAHCLQNFVLACPQQLLSCITICMNSLHREIGQLSTPRQSSRRCLGYAHGLASMLSTSRLQPLYGSVDIYSQVLSQATDLLKTSGSSELRIASTQIQVAWILIGGLLPLGPNFTKIHLSQLLLLWKNALPKALPKDDLSKRSPLELGFLAHVRECALSSILVFLEFNSKLVTSDGAKRIATMLQNTIIFLENLPRIKSTEDISQRLSPSLHLKDFPILVRRRVLQCFAKLVNLSHTNVADLLSLSNVLGLAISSFADPDFMSINPLDSSVASVATSFENLWDLDDNFGFGVTGLATAFSRDSDHRNESLGARQLPTNTDKAIDSMLISPICQGREHDSVLLYCTPDIKHSSLPDPPATEVVNAAIKLFATTLPLQAPKVQESSVEQIATLLASQSLARNPGRKAAMTVNIAVALLYTLRVAVKETDFFPGSLKNPGTEKIVGELLQTFITDPDYIVRTIAFEALGRLCNSAGNSYTNSQINSVIDTIVENRDPNARAGCAAALGSIHAQVGGMAAGFHLKTIIGVLMSLCSDPHPVVHFWALEGLLRVVDSAGLTFSAYVSGTLGMLARLYATDTHNEESSLIATSNYETVFSTPLAISRCVDALINVIGPDLRDITKTRELVFTLVKEFQLETDISMVAVSSRCLDHLSLYASDHMDFPGYVHWLQQELNSKETPVREAAVRGLNNIMKRDPERVIRTASSTFEDELWMAFDSIPDNEPLKDLVRNWLHRTGLTDTVAWVQRCHKVLTKARPKAEEASSPVTAVNTTAPDVPDDEVAGFASAAATENRDSGEPDSPTGQELLKWQTRNFAMCCLSELLSMVSAEIQPDQTIPSEAALQEKIGEIVRMAFSASTANVVELRIWGLKILDRVLKMFGKTPDPDFAEASLLEQYQAQIGSALTPAFATDSSPELASEAINVCATFVGTGIVTSVERMGRIFKLLVVGLENFANNPETTDIGDLKGLNSNARVMIKLALYSAWARLQIASAEQNYLVKVIQPYTAMLTPLWLSSLQEYARLRFEPDISSTLGSIGVPDNLDDTYAALNREILLNFYQDSWLNFVDAIASLVEKDSAFVFDALDNKEKAKPDQTSGSEPVMNGTSGKGNNINYRDEPVAFFFVLFGLAFEALVGQSSAPSSQILEILQALQKILRPSVAGNAVYQDAVFSETIDALDRLVMTEGHNIQSVIVEISRNLALHHQAAMRTELRTDSLSDDIEQLFELTRNIILVLAGILPNLSDSSPKARSAISEDSIPLIQLALSSLVDITSVFPSIIRSDLHACILHIFGTILATGSCQTSIVPPALPIFRRFILDLAAPSRHSNEETTIISHQIRGCITRFLSILRVAQQRESEASLPCAKNTLLALTILFTGSSHVIPSQDPLIPEVLQEMLDCLQDLGLASVAAGCIRSLLLSTPRSPTDDFIARFIFPRLIAFIAGIPTGIDGGPPNDPEHVKASIAHILVSCVDSATIPASAVPNAMALLIPALLQRAQNDGPDVYKDTAARLLELAQVDQISFRNFASSMEPSLRTLTEDILRSTGSGGSAGRARRDMNDDGAAAPSITLRMDF